MTINHRVKEYLDFKGIKYAELGRSITSQRGDVAKWFNKNGMTDIPPKKVIEIIREFKDLDARWLITGEGEMLDLAFDEADLNDKKAVYGKDTLQFVHELSKEIGHLEMKVMDLEQENRKLKEKYGEQDQKKNPVPDDYYLG